MAQGWHNSTNTREHAPIRCSSPREEGLPIRSLLPQQAGVLMDDKERLERAQEALGYTFQNPELLSQSLRHPSSTDQRVLTLASGWSF